MLSFIRRLFRPRDGVTISPKDQSNAEASIPGPAAANPDPPAASIDSQDATPKENGGRPHECASEIPLDAYGYQKVSSRSRPWSFYYRNALPAPIPDVPKIRGDGLFTYRVPSAAHYQSELEAVAGGQRDAKIIFRTNCLLCPDPENPHDSDAVAVRIGGMKVGYIARADNRQILSALSAAGVYDRVQCRAEICGEGFGQATGSTKFRLSLDLFLPIEIVSGPKRQKRGVASKNEN